MALDGGSRELKVLCCYFHVGGKFVCNSEGKSEYKGGGVKMKTIKEGITFEDLRLMISSWLGMDSNMCDIKYTVSFDEKMLIDLNDDGEVGNLFDYNDKVGHIYVASKGNDNSSDIMDDVDM